MKRKQRKARRLNPIAKALRSKALQARVVRARKGRGSYTRKGEKATLARSMDSDRAKGTYQPPSYG